MKIYFCVFFVLLVFVFSALGQDKRTAYVGAKIIPIVGKPIESGFLLVHRGKIISVGAAENIIFTADTKVFDVRG